MIYLLPSFPRSTLFDDPCTSDRPTTLISTGFGVVVQWVHWLDMDTEDSHFIVNFNIYKIFGYFILFLLLWSQSSYFIFNNMKNNKTKGYKSWVPNNLDVYVLGTYVSRLTYI